MKYDGCCCGCCCCFGSLDQLQQLAKCRKHKRPFVCTAYGHIEIKFVFVGYWKPRQNLRTKLNVVAVVVVVVVRFVGTFN